MNKDISKCKDLIISLEESRHELEIILNNIPLIAILLDKEGRIRKYNEAANTFKSKKESPIIGNRPGNAFDCIHALSSEKGCGFSKDCEHCQIQSQFLDTLINKKTIKDTAITTKYGNKEQIFNVTTSYIKVNNEDMVLFIMEDISYKKKIIHEESVQERLIGVLETAGAACHELNQPLQVLSANIEFLEANLDKPEKREKLLNRINDSIDKLGSITKKLSQITKYKTKKYIKDKNILDIESSAPSD